MKHRVLAITLTAACASGAAPDTQIEGHTVALLTGDRVTLSPQGQPRIQPAPGRERIGFATVQHGEHTYVIPQDVVPRLAAGELDRAQFDVGSAPRSLLRAAAKPLGATREADAPTYALTLRATDRDGNPGFSFATIADRATGEIEFPSIHGEETFQLPAGTYALTSIQGDALIGYPLLVLDRDTTVELDERLASPIAPAVAGVELAVDNNVAEIFDFVGRIDVAFSSPWTLSTAQLGPAVPPDELRSWVVYSGTATSSSPANPAHYTLAKVESGRVVTGWQATVARSAFASVDMRHISDPDNAIERRMSPWIEDAQLAGPLGAGTYTYGAHARSTEYVYGPGLAWFPSLFTILPDGWFSVRSLDGVRDYRPGHHYAERWNRAPYSPTFGNVWGDPPAMRSGDEITLSVAQYSDANARSSRDMARMATETDHAALYRDGVLVADDDDDNGQVYVATKVASAPATYRFETHATCGADPDTGAQVFDLSTKIDAAWTFASASTDAPEILPLPTVRFHPELDDDNRAGKVLVLPVEVRRPDGAKQVPIASIAVEISYDDGATWTKVPGAKLGERWLGIVVHPSSARYASLRGHARDSEGRTNDITVVHAYRL